MNKKPELLAPAGGREALIAAVQNGADAVYLGAGSFNARQTADNFHGDGLREAIDYCHARNVRVYVTLNTMVREDEFDSLESSIRAIADAHADAVLVQDFGVARAVRQMAPELDLHASTQMAVHNRAGVEFLAKQGFTRVVLAREMDLESIRECAQVGVELEVFVHGALCVSCSGQCLFSSLVGGRSGNRGRCAQPCRLEYHMDGTKGHLLSTRDLCSFDTLDALAEAGVDSFKIEGRLKRPEYVAVITSAYRRAMDHPGIPQDIDPLKQMFNRGGFTKGYVPGVDDSELMFAQRPNHLGLSIGSYIKNGQIHLDADVDPDDVLALRSDYSCEDRPVKLSGLRGSLVSCREAKPGDQLIRLVSEAQMREARESFSDEHRQSVLTASLTLHVGKRAKLVVFNDQCSAETYGDIVEAAKSRGADLTRIETQLRKTGGTPYCFDRVFLDVDENAFYPISALNALRRDALERITEQRKPQPYTLHALNRSVPQPPVFPASPQLIVQSGDPKTLRTAAENGADHILFAPEDVRTAALEKALSVLPEHFMLALPMVLPEKSLRAIHAWARQHADRIEGTYLSNIAHFELQWPGEKHGDFSLNCANAFAAQQLLEWGCVDITPSVELTAAQIDAIPSRREWIVHGRLPLMQLRHCPYRATHGLKGKHADCRRCDSCAMSEHINAKVLTDRKSVDFPLRRLATDEGCIVRVMNSVPLMLLKKIQKLPKANAWRLILDENDDVASLLRLYRAASKGENFRNDPVWEQYETLNTTTGHYFRGAE